MRYPDHIMTEKFNWEAFLDPYIQAVGELKIKLRGA
jgi:putative GTP pyrophosphokinase